MKQKKVRKKRSNVVLGLFIGIGILVLVLIGLVMSSLGFFESDREPEMFTVKDSCGLTIVGLIHQIQDEGDCRVHCMNECDVRKMDFVDFEFEMKENDCHSCRCWCK